MEFKPHFFFRKISILSINLLESLGEWHDDVKLLCENDFYFQ